MLAIALKSDIHVIMLVAVKNLKVKSLKNN